MAKLRDLDEEHRGELNDYIWNTCGDHESLYQAYMNAYDEARELIQDLIKLVP